MIEYIKQISDFLKSNSCFQKQEDDPGGRRYYFIIDGEKVAYIWFKWALNGWRLTFYKEKEGEDWETREPIESVEQLKKVLSL